MKTDFIVHHREPSCTIVKFFYYLANLRHYNNGIF